MLLRVAILMFLIKKNLNLFLELEPSISPSRDFETYKMNNNIHFE